MPQHRFRLLPAIATLALIFTVIPPALAQWNEQVLYSFQGGSDGYTPTGSIVFDKAGNLYGVTTDGGSQNCSPVAYCGTVYQLKPPAIKGGSWTETVLYVFKGKQFNDGELPAGGLVIDAQGNLYGTTAYGGTGSCVLLGTVGGCGTVFELSPPSLPGGAWMETVIYSFATALDGYLPAGDLVWDSKGNLYGVTEFGGGLGVSCNPYYEYCGTVFELTPPAQKGLQWTKKTLHAFRGNSEECCGNRPQGYTPVGDGAGPNGGLAFDSQGNLYGTTFYGGNSVGSCNYGGGGTGCGTVFELRPPPPQGGEWTETIIHRFEGQDGANPPAGVVLDASGNLYGATYFGPEEGFGLVFQLKRPTNNQRQWQEATVLLFEQANGEYPDGPLAFDRAGRLYGTTIGSTHYHGEVFQLVPMTGTASFSQVSVLHEFTNSPDGGHPDSQLVFDMEDDIYGSTQWGGTGSACQGGCGTIFKISQ